MELKTFFDNFEYMAEAPNGIQKLREMILQLAVQGKLVLQDPNDEPASILIERVRFEKNRLPKGGKFRKPKPMSPLNMTEVPYKMPSQWEWVRLGFIGYTQTGTTPSKTHSEYFGSFIPFIKPADIDANRINYNNEGLSQIGLKQGRFIEKHSIMMVCIGGSIGKVNFIERDCSCNQQINTITLYTGILHKLINYFMRSPYFQDEVISRAPKATLPILSKGKWEQIPIPLPPLNEQKRIVAKVDELMVLCDNLEARKQKTHQTCIKLNDASIDKLMTAPTPDKFNRHWKRIYDNFDLLYSKPENVTKLRQSILQLAVQGKLVRQDPNDESASLLFEKIKAEKNQLAKEGAIKISKPLPIIGTEDYPYTKPLGWVWVRLGQISLNVHYGYTASADSSIKNVRLLRITDIQNGRVNWDLVPGCKIESKAQSQFLLNPGDLLIARTGGTIGKTFLVEDTPFPAVFASYLIRAIPSSYVYPSFLKVFFGSNLYWTQLYNKTSGTGQPNVNATSLKTLIFPLPPIEEQKRIVAKVDEFTALCDELEYKLSEGQSDNNRLAEAAVADFLAA